VVRERAPGGRGWRYGLTEAGRDLHDVCLAIGLWGPRWIEIAPEDLDPYVVLWGLCKAVDREHLPHKRVTIRFEFRDWLRPYDRFWLVMQRPEPEVCIKPPGYREDLVVTTVADWLLRWHLGEVSLGQGLSERRVEVVGPSALVASLRTWGGQSSFAGLPRADTAAPASTRRPRAHGETDICPVCGGRSRSRRGAGPLASLTCQPFAGTRRRQAAADQRAPLGAMFVLRWKTLSGS
jgi:hypothetical protein